MNDNPIADLTAMRRDGTFHGSDGAFHVVDWGGNGPVMHLAHATGLCAGLYSPLSEKLRAHLHVVGMDDRGHGRTTAPAVPGRLSDWEVFAADLERFVESLGGPVIGMGHSRGAVATLLVAARRPELIRALILIDPTMLPPSWMGRWRLAKMLKMARWVPIARRAAKRQRVWPDPETVLRAYRGRGMFRTWRDGFLEAYIADGTEPDGSGAIRLCCDPAWESRCYATCPHDVWRFVPRLRQPTLVIYGAESDTFLPEAAARFQAAAPHAHMKRFENASHFVPMEYPEDTVTAVLSFLGEEKLLASSHNL